MQAEVDCTVHVPNTCIRVVYYSLYYSLECDHNNYLGTCIPPRGWIQDLTKGGGGGVYHKYNIKFTYEIEVPLLTPGTAPHIDLIYIYIYLIL